MRSKQISRILSRALGMLCCGSAALCGFALPAVAEEVQSQAVQAEGVAAVEDMAGLELASAFAVDSRFVYRREGRPDPFMPFVTERKVLPEAEPLEVLTGMRAFEPGQLTLVAVVFVEDKALAMVQDSMGKGYIVREGTLVGRSGKVESIAANRLLIQERYMTMSGVEQYRPVEMLLKKERE